MVTRCLTRLRSLLDVPDQIRASRERSWVVDGELRALRAQVDYLLSSAEVSAELAAEFQEWKRRNPVPAEPLVSVCVATYNRARQLMERCIPSVLKQSYPRLELIIVGDGCTDETERLVARCGDSRVTFVNLPQRGSYPADPMLRWMVAGSPAINHSMSLARGYYVTHLDDDDEYLADRLEKLTAFAIQHGCDFVWHPFWRENAHGRWELQEAPEFAHRQVTTSSVFYRCWFTKIPWDVEAYRRREPGDWNRFRRIAHLRPDLMRYPEPLLRHYREGRNKR